VRKIRRSTAALNSARYRRNPHPREEDRRPERGTVDEGQGRKEAFGIPPNLQPDPRPIVGNEGGSLIGEPILAFLIERFARLTLYARESGN